MHNDFVKTAMESRARHLEAAIHRFRDCGVEVDRFSIIEQSGDDTRESVLCVDGIPRFVWRLVWPGDLRGKKSG